MSEEQNQVEEASRRSLEETLDLLGDVNEEVVSRVAKKLASTHGFHEDASRQMVRLTASAATAMRAVLFALRRSEERLRNPPRSAERFLLLIAPKRVRECLPEDLEEEFRAIAARHGYRFARRWYWVQVALSSWPLLRYHVLNWLGLGFGSKLAEWVTRRLGL